MKYILSNLLMAILFICPLTWIVIAMRVAYKERKRLERIKNYPKKE